MSQKKDRRAKRLEKRDARRAVLREGYHDVLRRTGFDPDALPRDMREFVGSIGGFNPRAIVRLEGGGDDPILDELIEVLSERGDDDVSPLEFLEVIPHCLGTICRHKSRLLVNPFALGDLLRHLEAVWDERFQPIALEAVTRVTRVLRHRSRLDVALYNLKLERMNEDGPGIAITVVRAAAERRDLRIDGLTRPVFRVARREPEGIRRVEWDSMWLGLQGPRRSIPVYVQSHALAHLNERLEDIESEGDRQHLLAGSLDEPVVTKREASGDFLVELRLPDAERLGHLVVSVVGEVAVVRTFLFLTMEGTPECSKLRRMLRLSRADIEYLELNRLRTFAASDLKRDPMLRARFEACGLGQLFGLEPDEPEEVAGVAADVRRYLGINRAG
jgi:hypothetical protein